MSKTIWCASFNLSESKTKCNEWHLHIFYYIKIKQKNLHSIESKRKKIRPANPKPTVKHFSMLLKIGPSINIKIDLTIELYLWSCFAGDNKIKTKTKTQSLQILSYLVNKWIVISRVFIQMLSNFWRSRAE